MISSVKADKGLALSTWRLNDSRRLTNYSKTVILIFDHIDFGHNGFCGWIHEGLIIKYPFNSTVDTINTI
jgi:hypothetical protein